MNIISPDLCQRWKGALFSLNPNNPDAGRHFCTSTREIFVNILDLFAPNSLVLAKSIDCEKTQGGEPTRKSKIKHILTERGLVGSDAVDFIDEDIENVLHLFKVFNDGTHGSAGHYQYNKLLAIKKRVEDGIHYLTKICTFSVCQ